MYICECGEVFEVAEDNEVMGAREHMLEQHLDLIETAYQDYLDADDEIFADYTAEELYEDALEDVIDDMLDEIIDG